MISSLNLRYSTRQCARLAKTWSAARLLLASTNRTASRSTPRIRHAETVFKLPGPENSGTAEQTSIKNRIAATTDSKDCDWRKVRQNES
jgi:hypothetical protein